MQFASYAGIRSRGQGQCEPVLQLRRSYGLCSPPEA